MIELMVTTGIVGGLVLMLSTLMVRMTQDSAGISERMAFDEDIEVFQIAFERPFRTAVNVQWSAAALAPALALTAAAPGSVSIYDSDGAGVGNNDGGVDLIGLFYRENRYFPTAAPFEINSKFTPTAVYFQRPTATTFGRIFVSNGVQETAANLTPGATSATWGKIVHLRFRNPTSKGIYLRSFEAEVVMRYPTGSASGATGALNNIVWCPAGDIGTAPCVQSVRNYRDVRRTFTIDLKNNGSPTSGFDDMLYGRLYFMH